jgi:hypothetical protein
MEISFVLDWASFFVGVAATVVVSFIALVGIAYGQYRKQRGGNGLRRNR